MLLCLCLASINVCAKNNINYIDIGGYDDMYEYKEIKTQNYTYNVSDSPIGTGYDELDNLLTSGKKSYIYRTDNNGNVQPICAVYIYAGIAGIFEDRYLWISHGTATGGYLQIYDMESKKIIASFGECAYIVEQVGDYIIIQKPFVRSSDICEKIYISRYDGTQQVKFNTKEYYPNSYRFYNNRIFVNEYTFDQGDNYYDLINEKTQIVSVDLTGNDKKVVPDINSLESLENSQWIKENIPADAIKIKLDGKDLICDTYPININGRVLLPVRNIAEAVGAEVSWYDDTQTVILSSDSVNSTLTIGSFNVVINDQNLEIDSKPMIWMDRTYVPVRFVANTFNLNVDWDDSTKTVLLSH